MPKLVLEWSESKMLRYLSQQKKKQMFLLNFELRAASLLRPYATDGSPLIPANLADVT